MKIGKLGCSLNLLLLLLNYLIKSTVCYSQRVQADQGNLSHHAVRADRRYHADHPNPEDLKVLEDPERRKNENKY